MTDTEILDYLQASITRRTSGLNDWQIGSVLITYHKHSSLRALLEEAIEKDRLRTAARVARRLEKANE